MVRTRSKVLAGTGLALLAIFGASVAEAGAASPKIRSAFTLDRDGDGRVDGVDVRFSAAVKGTPPAGAFKVKDLRVTGAGKARGRRVNLTVAEGTGCDAGGKPSVSFSGRGLKDRRGRKVRRSRIDMERRDRSAPRMVCAITEDGDRDGRVDAVALTYSKRVRGRARTRGPFLFTVGGYSVRAVDAPSGRSVRVLLRERSGFDTDATPPVTYRRPAGKAERAYAVRGRGRRGGQAFAGSFRNTRDRIAPISLGGRTQDADSDAQLDGVSIAFSEPVQAGAGSFSVAGARLTGLAPTGNDSFLLRIAEGPHGTAARPAVTAGTLRDTAGNPAQTGAITPADGAAPLLSAARTADLGGAIGRLDTVRVSFSEPVTGGGAGAGPFGVTGYNVTSVAPSGQFADLRLQEGPGPDTGARPAVGYTRGRAPALRDPAGNEVASRAFSGTTDGVAPRLLAATTLDGDANGRLDRLRFAFSEPVQHPAQAGPGGFSAGGLTAVAAQAASGANVDLTVAEGPLFNTGLRPAAAYSPTGTNGVRDASGNLAGAGSLALASDGARPVAVAVATADTGGSNQRIDRVQVDMSEPVIAAADVASPFSFAAGGYTVSSVGAASGGALAINLTEGADPDTGAAPGVGYTGQGVKVVDASGLESPVRDYPGLTRDAVPPRLVATQTRDGDADGKLDAIELRYTEQVQGAAAPGPFTISAPGRAVQGVSYPGSAVRLAVAEAGSPDTDERPTVAYVPGDLTDVPEGSGDVADPVPAVAAQQVADAAGPAVVAARTLDGDGDGIVDGVSATFSEPLQHPADSTAPFALRVADRSETAVSSPGGASDEELVVSVNEAPGPDGGLRPDVAVVAAGTAAERIRDLASPVNEAPETTFDGTSDGVRPRLVSAQMGESSSGACDRTPAVNGRLDCVRLRWSEPISHSADVDGNYPIGLDNGYSVAAAGVPATATTETLDLPLQEKASPDRDKTAAVSYDDAVETPVRDAADNESLSGSVTAERACGDTVNEDNDSRGAGNPAPALTPTSSLERRCAFDDDFFKVTAGADGVARTLVRPSPSLASEVRVLDSAGATVGSPSPANGPGEVDEITVGGLSAGAEYWVRVHGNDSPDPQEGSYCMSVSLTASQPPNCGPNAGELVLTEIGMDGAAASKFIELRNVSDFPLDTAQVQLQLKIGAATCNVDEPAGAESVITPGEYVVVTDDTGVGPFRCADVGALASGGDAVRLESSGSLIDSVDTSGILTSALATGHSLQVRAGAETGQGNDDVAGAWCRTWAADTRGAAGDGCDEYRVNEVLFNPASSGGDGIQGRAFVELIGNLPAKAGSGLLGNWVIRGVNGETGDGTADFTLPASASPRANGTYVVADGVDGATPQRSNVSGPDVVWDDLDLGDFNWPDMAGANPGPRGIQLLLPTPPANPPCGGALADVMAWRQTAETVTRPADLLRRCASVEGSPVGTIAAGSSASRLNLTTAGSTSYVVANDSGNNATDLCRRGAPSPGQLNAGPCN